MIQILILTEGLNIGGQQKYTLRQVRHTDRNTYNFTIGYPTDGPLRSEYEALGVNLFKFPDMSEFYQRIWRGRIPVINPLRLVAPVRKIVSFVRQNNISVIQTNDVFTYVLGSIVSRITHVPSVRIQGNIMRETEHVHYKLFSYLPFSCWTAKYVLFCIEAQKKDFLSLGVPEEKLYYIDSFGVDLDEFHPRVSDNKFREEFGIHPDAPVVGQAGRLSVNKRFDFTLNAACLILDEVPETVFLVAGDGPERSNLEKLSKELGIEQSVIFTGFRSDMPQVTACFDIALFTMADMTGGTSNWEAMAAGKPVVCTNNVIIEHGKTGFSVPSNDIQAFANAVVTLIRSPELRHKMGKKARELSEERYDFVKTVIPKMQHLYDIVAAG